MLQAKLHSRTPEPRRGGHKRPLPWRKLICRVAGTASMVVGCCGSLEAEEQILSVPREVQAISTDFFSVSRRSGLFTLTLAPEPSGLSLGEFLPGADDWRLKSILQKPVAQGELGPDNSIMLFRKQMPSRHSYHAWAGLGTGFGQFFAGDTFGRSRTNGVGIEDPRWLYLKMSLRF